MREKINSVHERFIFEKENSLRVQKKKFMFEKFSATFYFYFLLLSNSNMKIL